jgi:hypothetical protein
MLETTLTDSEVAVMKSAVLPPAPTRQARRIVLADGAEYVLDGNRVRAHLDAAPWWLETANRDGWLRVTSAGRVWVYQKNGDGHFARTREILDAWEMTTPMADALADCDQHGHAWSPDQLFGPEARLSFVWAWCLVCGVGRVASPGLSRELIWPADANLIQLATGRLPKLHGPLFGGQE